MIHELDIVSTRLYYMYYRLLQSMAGQQESFSKFTLGTVAASVSFVATLVNIIPAVEGLDLATRLWVLLGSVLFGVLILWGLNQYWIPKTKWEETQATVRLGIHLSEIRSSIQELDLLNTMPRGSRNLASALKSYDLRILDEAIGSIERLIVKLKQMGQYDKALGEIKNTQMSVTELINGGRLALRRKKSLGRRR